MAASDERREVAERLRAEMGFYDEKAVFNAVFGRMPIEMYISERKRLILRIADLIDPTCRAVRSDTSNDDELVCSECDSSLGVSLRDGRTLLPRHCACCGARVMRGDTDE
ncbi:hypothetical protein [Olsenella profusa]|nr:hypothetical protein [Olsenella profusa]